MRDSSFFFFTSVIKNIRKPYFLLLYHCDNLGQKVDQGNTYGLKAEKDWPVDFAKL